MSLDTSADLSNSEMEVSFQKQPQSTPPLSPVEDVSQHQNEDSLSTMTISEENNNNNRNPCENFAPVETSSVSINEEDALVAKTNETSECITTTQNANTSHGLNPFENGVQASENPTDESPEVPLLEGAAVPFEGAPTQFGGTYIAKGALVLSEEAAAPFGEAAVPLEGAASSKEEVFASLEGVAALFENAAHSNQGVAAPFEEAAIPNEISGVSFESASLPPFQGGIHGCVGSSAPFENAASERASSYKGAAASFGGVAASFGGASDSNEGARASYEGAKASHDGARASYEGAVASCVGTSTSHIGSAASCVGTPTSYAGSAASCVGTPISNVGSAASGVGTPTSNVGSATSYVGTLTSCVGVTASSNGGAGYSLFKNNTFQFSRNGNFESNFPQRDATRTNNNLNCDNDTAAGTPGSNQDYHSRWSNGSSGFHSMIESELVWTPEKNNYSKKTIMYNGRNILDLYDNLIDGHWKFTPTELDKIEKASVYFDRRHINPRLSGLIPETPYEDQLVVNIPCPKGSSPIQWVRKCRSNYHYPNGVIIPNITTIQRQHLIPSNISYIVPNMGNSQRQTISQAQLISILANRQRTPISNMGSPQRHLIPNMGSPQRQFSNMGNPQQLPISNIPSPQRFPISNMGSSQRQPISSPQQLSVLTEQDIKFYLGLLPKYLQYPQGPPPSHPSSGQF